MTLPFVAVFAICACSSQRELHYPYVANSLFKESQTLNEIRDATRNFPPLEVNVDQIAVRVTNFSVKNSQIEKIGVARVTQAGTVSISNYSEVSDFETNDSAFKLVVSSYRGEVFSSSVNRLRKRAADSSNIYSVTLCDIRFISYIEVATQTESWNLLLPTVTSSRSRQMDEGRLYGAAMNEIQNFVFNEGYVIDFDLLIE